MPSILLTNIVFSFIILLLPGGDKSSGTLDVPVTEGCQAVITFTDKNGDLQTIKSSDGQTKKKDDGSKPDNDGAKDSSVRFQIKDRKPDTDICICAQRKDKDGKDVTEYETVKKLSQSSSSTQNSSSADYEITELIIPAFVEGAGSLNQVIIPVIDASYYIYEQAGVLDTLHAGDQVQVIDGTISAAYSITFKNATSYATDPNLFSYISDSQFVEALPNFTGIVEIVGFSHEKEYSSAGLGSFGEGRMGCSGSHFLWASAVPVIGDTQFQILSTEAPANSFGFVIVGDVPDEAGSDISGLDFLLHISLASNELILLDIYSDAAGNGVAPSPIPNNPALSGRTYYAQAIWYAPPACENVPFGFSSSLGLIIQIQ